MARFSWPEHFIHNTSGARLALTHIPAQQPSRGPVVFAHGTFSNHRTCCGLAQHIANSGYDSWIMDFQGHGLSDQPTIEPDFESMCLQDTEATIEYIKKCYPGQPITWVGHSGGGLAILMYLARNPQAHCAIGHIVTLASQATHAAKNIGNQLGIRFAAFFTSLLGTAPGKLLKLGPEDEFSPVMRQWYRWNLSGRWLGKDGFDYELKLSELQIPCLMLAATADRFIAPLAGCAHLFDCYGGNDKTFQLCGIETGFLEDYSHARIISSRNASKDVWPLIEKWLQERADRIHPSYP
ncbi:MAG: alpha/beta fold hydrolase [Granulosicoccus sp.]